MNLQVRSRNRQMLSFHNVKLSMLSLKQAPMSLSTLEDVQTAITQSNFVRYITEENCDDI